MSSHRKLANLKLPSFICIVLLVIAIFSCDRTNNKSLNTPSNDSGGYRISIRQLYDDREYAKADSLLETGDFDKAEDEYLLAIRILEKEGNREGVIAGLRKLGILKRSERKYDTAEIVINRAISLCNETYSDTFELSELYYNMSVIKYLLSKPDEALNYINKSMDLYAEQPSQGNERLVRNFMHKGDIFRWLLLDYENAETNYLESISILEQSDVQYDYKNYFLLYYNLASVNRFKKDYINALNYANRALHLTDSCGELSQIYKMMSNVVIGNVHSNLDDYKTSRKYYSIALDLLNNISDSYKNYIPGTKTNYALSYNADDDVKAISLYKEILTEYQNTPENFDIITSIYFYISNSYSDLNNYDSALYMMNEYKHYINNSTSADSLDYVEYYFRNGLIFAYFNYLDTAANYIEKSLNWFIDGEGLKGNYTNLIYKRNIINPLFIEPLQEYAEINYDKYRKDSSDLLPLNISLNCYYILDSIYTNYKNSSIREESVLLLSENYMNNYESSIECASELFRKTKNKKYIIAAHYFMEKTKARILLEKFTKDERYNQAGIPDSIKKIEKEYYLSLNFYKEKLLDTLNKNAAYKKFNEEKVFYYTRKLENLKKHLRSKYSNYYQIKYLNDVIHFNQVQNYSTANDKAIIQYFFGEKNIYILGINNEKAILKSVPVSSSLITSLNTYLNNLQSTGINTYNLEGFKEFCADSYTLYQVFVKNVLELSENKQKQPEIIIITDGILAGLPFETLISSTKDFDHTDYKSLDYLIKNSSISYAFSSSILLNQENNSQKRRVKNILFMGYAINPFENNHETDLIRELKSINKSGHNSLFTGNKATKSKFVSQAGKYDLIHLAVHGEFDSMKINEPGLIFYPPNSTLDTNILYANEVYNLELKSSLVVLSACETGTGTYFEGEGVYSMARAFSYSGCPTLVMSLWKVKDKATNNLMNAFYRNILKKNSLDLALTKSKLEYLRNSDELTAHPSNWASFVIIRNTNPIHYNRSKGLIRFSIVLFIIITGTVFLYIKNKRSNN